MTGVWRRCRMAGCFAVLGALAAACTGMRAVQGRVAAVPAPPPAAAEPAPAPAPAEESPPGLPPPPPAASLQARSGCTCAEARSTAKPKPKGRLVRKGKPVQAPTAPPAETVSGGTVDAQVQTMGVPVMSILGKKVKGAKGEDLGRVVDVLADASGRVRIAIIDFGGFLGVGNHRIAVDWPLLRFNADAQDPFLLLNLSRQKLAAAPEYKETPRPKTLTEAIPGSAEDSKK